MELADVQAELINRVHDWLKAKGGEVYGLERPHSLRCQGAMTFNPADTFFAVLVTEAWEESNAWCIPDIVSLTEAAYKELPPLAKLVPIRVWFEGLPESSDPNVYVKAKSSLSDFCQDHEEEFIRPRSFSEGVAIKLNVPGWFKHPVFIEWLVSRAGDGLATWHRPGERVPGDWSDVFVGVDPGLSGEGTDSDMPEPFWGYVVKACRDANVKSTQHILVWLSPV
jgi:hypothetical protein